MTNLSPDHWKLVASAGTDDRGHRRRLIRTVHGTRDQATEALADLVEAATAMRNVPEAETLFRLAMTMPDTERAYLAARLLDSLK